jgi:hypothetical protein
MTTQTIAAEINRLKPDLTEFWTDPKLPSPYELITEVDYFRFELAFLYSYLHPRVYMGRTDHNAYRNFFSYLDHRSIYAWGQNPLSQANFIISQVDNPKQYLNAYLRKRAGFVTLKAKSTFTIKPDLFSLELFRKAMTKQIPSTVALEYVYKIANFPLDMYDSYLEIILSKLVNPSKKFQDSMADMNYTKSYASKLCETKYIHLDRYTMRATAKKLFSTLGMGLRDTLDSQYTPFIGGIPRKPTPALAETDALLNAYTIVAADDHPQREYILQCLREHLSHQDYVQPLEELFAKYRNNATQTLNFIEEMTNG